MVHLALHVMVELSETVQLEQIGVKCLDYALKNKTA